MARPGDFQRCSQRTGLSLDSRALRRAHPVCACAGASLGPLVSFDLVITTPQYRVAPHANVLNNTLTLHSVTPEQLGAAREQWADTLPTCRGRASPSSPAATAVPLALGPLAASRLARQASMLRARMAVTAGLHQFAHQRRSDGCTAGGIDVPNYFIAGKRLASVFWPWPTGSSSRAIASRCYRKLRYRATVQMFDLGACAETRCR